MITTDEVRAAERAVVGDCIFAPHNVRRAAAHITPDDFESVRLGQLFGLIVAMVTAEGTDAVTPLTVVQEVGRRKAAPDQAGDRRAVLWPDAGELAALVTHGTTGIAETHARMIREAAVGRQIAAFGRRTLTAIESGEAPASVSARMVEEAKAIRDGSQNLKISARLLADVFADEDRGYDWLIPGLLERLDRLVYTGAEGSGKSTFGRQVALCAASGLHPFEDQTFEPITVTVIDAENSETQWRRKARVIALAVKNITGRDPAQRVHLVCGKRIDITKADGIGAVHQILDETRPGLLLIGPLYKLVPRAITNDDDAAPVLAALDSIRDRVDGPALMMEAHAGHALGKGGERDYRPRGSSALLGWPEFGFGFAPDAKDPARIEVIRWRGDRDERAWPKAMRRGGTLPWTNDAAEPGKDRQPAATKPSDPGYYPRSA